MLKFFLTDRNERKSLKFERSTLMDKRYSVVPYASVVKCK